MLILAASLFFTSPVPLEMPRAEAYFVREAGRIRLEDRYRRGDLWTSRAVLGRWMDDEGRVFMLAKLDVAAPAVDAEETVTRLRDAEMRVPLKLKDASGLRTAVAALAPCDVPEEGESPRRRLRGFKEILYWQGTNAQSLVCTFLPERSPYRFLAVWELADEDDLAARCEDFETEFLEKWPTFGWLWKGDDVPPPGEREALRLDARQSIANYTNWHWTDAPEFTVLDALPRPSSFVTALTNELGTMRARYAETLPTQIDGSNALCVARIFASREDYLDAVGQDYAWSAAIWDVARRELTAYLPPSGEEALLKTIRHEAFHQYLSYACAMIPASPWLNEGYAEYFEDTNAVGWTEHDGRRPTEEELALYAARLPELTMMDYAEFYAGTDAERRLKYRLAWSLAVFLERGAPKVRFKPFKTLKDDYVAALFETQDMRLATAAAFRNRDFLEKFIGEWLKFWKNT